MFFFPYINKDNTDSIDFARLRNRARLQIEFLNIAVKNFRFFEKNYFFENFPDFPIFVDNI